MSFGDELRELRKSKRLTIGQLATYTGLNSGFISQIETGKRNIPKVDTLERIAKGLKISNEQILSMAGIVDSSTKLNVIPSSSSVSLPIYGRISAGYPEGAEEDIDGHIHVDEDIIARYGSDNLLALRVDGESMNKVIPNGAVAILAKIDTSDISNGDICGVIINGDSATLKHVYMYPDRIRFEPDSWLAEQYKSFEYSKEDIENGQPPIQIIGKLVYMQATF